MNETDMHIMHIDAFRRSMVVVHCVCECVWEGELLSWAYTMPNGVYVLYSIESMIIRHPKHHTASLTYTHWGHNNTLHPIRMQSDRKICVHWKKGQKLTDTKKKIQRSNKKQKKKKKLRTEN